MRCELCGYEFDSTSLECHSQCPMSRGCIIICCPNCGYQVPDVAKSQSAALLNKVGDLWLRLRRKEESA